MKTISCIIVDDEPLAVKLMESYAAKTPFLSLQESFTSGTAAYSFLQDTPVDLLFCDIQMPNLSGMELSKMLPPKTRIIFTTAFSEYAVEGFRVRALDYLLKPISYDDFLAAALKAKEYFELIDGQSPTPIAEPTSPVAEPVTSVAELVEATDNLVETTSPFKMSSPGASMVGEQCRTTGSATGEVGSATGEGDCLSMSSKYSLALRAAARKSS